MSIERIRSELNKARKHLLELSTRNRLLSIPKSTRSKLVRVVDEQSDEIYRLLLKKKKKFSFLPKESDEDEEESTEFQYDADYDFAQPDDEGFNEDGIAQRHTDTFLQTSMSSKKLQSRLLGMHGDARTYIEEQGVNILYFALGQLKWYEDENSDKERYAPLILIPVKLERASALSKFKLQVLEEEPSDNLTLAARLNEFGVEFPNLNIDEDFKPSQYFEKLSERVSGLKRWEVLPNAMVLGFFSFSKFLMYRDLDPEEFKRDGP